MGTDEDSRAKKGACVATEDVALTPDLRDASDQRTTSFIVS